MIPNQRKNPPFIREGGHDVVFDPLALEVSIIDRSGRSVWKKTNEETAHPIRWNGKNEMGQVIQSGDYLCKLVYPNMNASLTCAFPSSPQAIKSPQPF